MGITATALILCGVNYFLRMFGITGCYHRYFAHRAYKTSRVGQFLLFFGLAFNPTSSAGFTYPSPPGLPEFNLGALRLTQAYVGMLVLGPVVVIALALFLRRSRFGLAKSSGMRSTSTSGGLAW